MERVSLTMNETQQSASGSAFSDFASDTKFGGLVEQSVTKKVRNRLFQLMSYMDEVVPPLYALHSIVGAWRIVQLLGPSLAAPYRGFWKTGVAKSIVEIISVIWHIVPPQFRWESLAIVQFVYAGLLLMFDCLALMSAFMLRKNAKLPTSLAIATSVSVSTIMYLLHPIAIEMFGEALAVLINGEKTKYPMFVEIIAMICTFLFFAGAGWFFIHVSSFSFVFRPASLQSVLNHAQIFIAFMTYAITLVTAVASQLPRWPKAILTIIAAVLYASLLWIYYARGTVISTLSRIALGMVAVSGTVNMLLVAVYVIIKREAGQPEFFIMLAIIALSILVAGIWEKIRTNKLLLKLDQIMDNTDEMETIRSPGQLICLACAGMACGHPVCLDWSLFTYGTQTWPENVQIWATFGKFVAIYPEESAKLAYIVRNIMTRKLSGSLAKVSVAEASTIQMQRENTLSPELKRKMTRIQKNVSSTKRKLRNIWDLVIQANTHEVESSVNNAYDSTMRTHNDFTHLISQYPNNRFVARAYARFLQEVVGDFKAYSEWYEKIRLLQRGISVNQDIANIFGLHSMPLLPQRTANIAGNISATATDTFNDTSMIEEVDDDMTQHADQVELVRGQIEKLSIPAVKLIRVTAICLLVILTWLPAIIVLSIAPWYISTMTEPLNFMYQLSMLRSFNFQLPLWVHHYIMENVPFSDNGNKPLFKAPNFTYVPATLGNTKNTKEQLDYLLQSCSATLEEVNNFRSFALDSDTLSIVHTVLFSDVIEYDSYLNINTSTKIKGSLYNFYVAAVIEISSLGDRPLNLDIFDAPELLNQYLNANNMAVNMSDALTALTTYVTDSCNSMGSIAGIVEYSIVILYVIIWIILISVQIIKLRRDKLQIYTCLTSLPKNVVSQVSESLRILKKDKESTTGMSEGDTEISKQEENLLKIFATAGDSHSSSSRDSVAFVVCYCFILILACISNVLLCEMFQSIGQALSQNTPHLDDVMGTNAYMLGIFLALNNAAVANTNGYQKLNINEGIGGRPILSSLQRVSTRLETYLSYYHRARYGDSESDEPPLAGYQERADLAKEIMSCPDASQLYESLHDTYSCFEIDTQLILFEPMVYKFIQATANEMKDAKLDIHGELFSELWLLACNLYETMFFPMFDGIVDQVLGIMGDALPATRTPIIVLMIVATVFTFMILYFVSVTEEQLKFCLRMLLHCPMSVIMSTPKIIDVLSGDFQRHTKDSKARSGAFFDHVLLNLPDAIIITGNQFQIEKVNTSFQRIFHRDNIDGDARDFFNSSEFHGDCSQIFTQSPNEINKVTHVEFSYDGVSTYLAVSLAPAGQRYIITCRDETQTVNYNTLIKAERAKSDKMLASILPANLVPRVQAGEQNISFAVQSATVSFMDIVEFTPWCAANTAACVMATLNHLYREFDAICLSKSTMTKIKCIGDCYMAAGGIFSEINQPSQHAREMVEFGLEAIKAVGRVNEERSQSLRIRVGVNTGGPIVAGVLGTEKPTFEILGPAINMAQQMEHNGVPMHVHISRSVYELVYGGNFVIKERGQIEIKQGKVVTYLIDGLRNSD